MIADGQDRVVNIPKNAICNGDRGSEDNGGTEWEKETGRKETGVGNMIGRPAGKTNRGSPIRDLRYVECASQGRDHTKGIGMAVFLLPFCFHLFCRHLIGRGNIIVWFLDR